MFIANLKIINEVIYLRALNFLKFLSSNKKKRVCSVWWGSSPEKGKSSGCSLEYA